MATYNMVPFTITLLHKYIVYTFCFAFASETSILECIANGKTE